MRKMNESKNVPEENEIKSLLKYLLTIEFPGLEELLFYSFKKEDTHVQRRCQVTSIIFLTPKDVYS